MSKIKKAEKKISRADKFITFLWANRLIGCTLIIVNGVYSLCSLSPGAIVGTCIEISKTTLGLVIAWIRSGALNGYDLIIGSAIAGELIIRIAWRIGLSGKVKNVDKS